MSAEMFRICDGCGSKVSTNNGWVSDWGHLGLEHRKDTLNTYKEADLCSTCYGMIYKLVASRIKFVNYSENFEDNY